MRPLSMIVVVLTLMFVAQAFPANVHVPPLGFPFDAFRLRRHLLRAGSGRN